MEAALSKPLFTTSKVSPSENKKRKLSSQERQLQSSLKKVQKLDFGQEQDLRKEVKVLKESEIKLVEEIEEKK